MVLNFILKHPVEVKYLHHINQFYEVVFINICRHELRPLKVTFLYAIPNFLLSVVFPIGVQLFLLLDGSS